MTGNRMDENPENWQCVPALLLICSWTPGFGRNTKSLGWEKVHIHIQNYPQRKNAGFESECQKWGWRRVWFDILFPHLFHNLRLAFGGSNRPYRYAKIYLKGQ